MVSLKNMVYAGVERRSTCERRRGKDRRNLHRIETIIDSDRRIESCRRREDAFWLRCSV